MTTTAVSTTPVQRGGTPAVRLIKAEVLKILTTNAWWIFGIITLATQSNRLGVACVLFFLVLGFVLLWWVREERTAA